MPAWNKQLLGTLLSPSELECISEWVLLLYHILICQVSTTFIQSYSPHALNRLQYSTGVFTSCLIGALRADWTDYLLFLTLLHLLKQDTFVFQILPS